MPGLTSRCTDSDVVQLYCRLYQPLSASGLHVVVFTTVPNALLLIAPQVCPPAALAAGLVRSQAGTKFGLAASASEKPGTLHVRVVLMTIRLTGLFNCTMPPGGSNARLRDSDALIAVRPLPNRSYAAPSRGLRSLKLGMWLCAGKSRAGTNGPAGRCCAGTLPFSPS